MHLLLTHSRLGQFCRFPGSTRFQIENRNRGSTLLKNRVPASVGSRTDTRFPKPAPAKYPVLGTDSAPIEIPGCLSSNYRAESHRLQSKYPILFDEPPTKCNSSLQRTCEGATHNWCKPQCLCNTLYALCVTELFINWPHNMDTLVMEIC